MMSHSLTLYLESLHSRRGIFVTWLVKMFIIIFCLFGLFSIYRHLSSFINLSDDRINVEPTEDRRDRVYEQRRNHSIRVCQDYEEEITLHTVKMFDLVPPAPIGMNADTLVDRVKQFYWCKVPKAASTSWISLLLSDREFAGLHTSIGRQHMYLR